MGLTPPAGVVGQACRKPQSPRMVLASMVRFLPLVPVLRPASARKLLPVAWCCEKIYDLKMSHTSPITQTNYPSHIPTGLVDELAF